MEVARRVEHPRLAPAIVDVRQALEELLAHGRVARERRHDEREPRLAIGILEALELGLEDRSASGDVADAPGRARGRLRRFRPAAGRESSRRARQTCSSHATVSGVVATLRSAPNHAAFALVVFARVESGAEHRLELRRDFAADRRRAVKRQNACA